MLAAAVAVFARHVQHGGFSADDWAFAENVRHPSSGLFQDVWHSDKQRPVYAVYLGLTLTAVGVSSSGWLAIALCVNLAAALLFYIALRTFGLARLHAWSLGALLLVFPLSDATTLWFAATGGPLAVVLYCGGLTLTVRALRGGETLWGAQHVAGAILYALSIMAEEITAPLIATSALLYLFVTSRRQAFRRLCLDLTVVASVVGLVSYPLTPKAVNFGAPLMFEHFKAIIAQGTQVLAEAAFPVHYLTERRAIFAVVVVGLILGGWSVLSLRRPGVHRDLRQSLAVTATGVFVALAGWAILTPGDLGYSPGAVGNGNRVNALAALGVLLIVYGATNAGLDLATRHLPKRAGAAKPYVATACLLLVATGYVVRVERDIDVRDRAAADQAALLSAVHEQLPVLPPGSTLYVTGYTGATGIDIPVFNLPFDLINAVRYTWRDATLAAWPVLGTADGATVVACDRSGVSVMAAGADVPGEGAPYGRAYLVSYEPRFVRPLESMRSCRAVPGTH